MPVRLGAAAPSGISRAFGFTGRLRLVCLAGFPAQLSWESPDRKDRIVMDWLLWPILGRDIINIRMDEPYGIRRQHFEPDQEIIREGEIGRRLYIIMDGEVEVSRASPSGPEVSRRLAAASTSARSRCSRMPGERPPFMRAPRSNCFRSGKGNPRRSAVR